MSVSSSATDRVESPLPPLLAQRAHPFPLLSALPSESRRPLNTTSRKSDSAMRRKTRVDVDGGGSRESEARLQAPFTSKRMKSSLVQVGCMLFLAAAAAAEPTTMYPEKTCKSGREGENEEEQGGGGESEPEAAVEAPSCACLLTQAGCLPVKG